MKQAEVVVLIGKDNDTGDTVDIKCPACYFSKSVLTEKVAAFKRLINVKCKCGATFSVKLENRQKIRKATRLEGLYCDIALVEREKWRVFLRDPNRTNCNIKDLSVDGVAIVSCGAHSVTKGDSLRLRFSLDRGKNPIVELDVVVCNVKGDLFGCEFLDKSKYNKKIGFYLM